MKKLISSPSGLIPFHPVKLAAVVLIASTAATHATIVTAESFVGYSSELDLNGQLATGTGLTGNWTGAEFFKIRDTSLSMTGVYSSGGSAYLGSGSGNFARQASAALAEPLSSSTLYYGSYLFSFTSAGTTGRTVGAMGVGAATDTSDNTASFVWAGNGFNSSSTIEGPAVRAEGSAWQAPGIPLAIDTTYVMLFEFDAASSITFAWVLNQDQLTNFYGSLDSETLGAAPTATNDANGTVWSGVAGAGAIDPMSHLLLFALASTDATFSYTWDEMRISDQSFFEAVSVPEPSSLATLALGGLAIGCLLRRRHKA